MINAEKRTKTMKKINLLSTLVASLLLAGCQLNQSSQVNIKSDNNYDVDKSTTIVDSNSVNDYDSQSKETETDVPEFPKRLIRNLFHKNRLTPQDPSNSRPPPTPLRGES